MAGLLVVNARGRSCTSVPWAGCQSASGWGQGRTWTATTTPTPLHVTEGAQNPPPFFFETKERRDHLLGWREASKGWRKERERNRERQRRDRENKVEGGGRRWGYSIFRPYQYGTRGRGLVSRGPRRWTREPWPRPLAPYQQGEMPSNRRENVGSAGKSKWRMASSGAPFVSRKRRPPMTG